MHEFVGAPTGTRHGWSGPPATEADGWELAAACRTADPTTFFGPNQFEPKHERLAREQTALAICATCPVLDECREYAVVHGEYYGVWGGLGEADRRGLIASYEQQQSPRVARSA